MQDESLTARLSRDSKTAGLSVGPDWNILSTVGCVVKTICTHVQGPQRMKHPDFGEHQLSFSELLEKIAY